MLEEMSKIVKLRREHSSLRYGDFHTLLATENCFVYLRTDMNERIVVALNKSAQPQPVHVDFPQFYQVKKAVDVMNGQQYALSNHSLSLTIPAIGWLVLSMER